MPSSVDDAPSAPPVRTRDLRSDVEAEPQARLRRIGRAAAERLEEPIHRVGRDRAPLVRDRKHESGVAAAARRHAHGPVSGAVGQCVGQEIGEQLRDPPRVAEHRRAEIELGADDAAGMGALQLLDDLAQRPAQVQHLAPLDGDAAAQPAARQVEDVVHQPRHPPAAPLHLPDQRRGLRVERVARQQVEPGGHGSDGVAQVVAEDRDELLPQGPQLGRVDQRGLARVQALLQLDLRGDEFGEQLERRQRLGVAQRRGLPVEGADRAEDLAVALHDRDRDVAFEAV